MEIGILGSVVGKFAFDGRSVALVESFGLSEQGWHHLFHVVCHLYIKNIRAYIAHGCIFLCITNYELRVYEYKVLILNTYVQL